MHYFFEIFANSTSVLNKIRTMHDSIAFYMLACPSHTTIGGITQNICSNMHTLNMLVQQYMK